MPKYTPNYANIVSKLGQVQGAVAHALAVLEEALVLAETDAIPPAMQDNIGDALFSLRDSKDNITIAVDSMLKRE